MTATNNRWEELTGELRCAELISVIKDMVLARDLAASWVLRLNPESHIIYNDSLEPQNIAEEWFTEADARAYVMVDRLLCDRFGIDSPDTHDILDAMDTIRLHDPNIAARELLNMADELADR